MSDDRPPLASRYIAPAAGAKASDLQRRHGAARSARAAGGHQAASIAGAADGSPAEGDDLHRGAVARPAPGRARTAISPGLAQRRLELHGTRLEWLARLCARHRRARGPASPGAWSSSCHQWRHRHWPSLRHQHATADLTNPARRRRSPRALFTHDGSSHRIDAQQGQRRRYLPEASSTKIISPAGRNWA